MSNNAQCNAVTSPMKTMTEFENSFLETVHHSLSIISVVWFWSISPLDGLKLWLQSVQGEFKRNWSAQELYD